MSPQHILAYMRAAIRCHNPQSLDDWPIDDLRGVYHLLPKPRVTFQEWSDRMGISESPQEMSESNDRFTEFARSLSGTEISITPTPENRAHET